MTGMCRMFLYKINHHVACSNIITSYQSCDIFEKLQFSYFVPLLEHWPDSYSYFPREFVIRGVIGEEGKKDISEMLETVFNKFTESAKIEQLLDTVVEIASMRKQVGKVTS